MKRLALTLYLAAVAASAQTQLTPAEVAIHKAQADIAKDPGHFPYYNSLAMAYARRAREVSDSTYYNKAEETLKKSFSIQADNFEGLKVKTVILLGRREYAQALELATKLNKQVPDDVSVYGYMSDADVQLGNYKEAVDDAQWMLNIRPGNPPGLTRAGALREIYGDLDGAVEVLRTAYDAAPFQESEERAFLLTQIAHVKLLSGDAKAAEPLVTNALSIFPNYDYSIETLGRIRMAQQRYSEAAGLFQRILGAENLFAAGEALSKAGSQEQAAAAFAKFEALALKQTTAPDNANRELIAYYTDYAKDPAKALKLAQQEAAKRHDIYTLDSYAWALAASGDYLHAQTEMRKALATGAKDPAILEHAAAIANHLEAQKNSGMK